MSEVKLEDIVSLAKRRGFIFPGSDVYGGLSGTWDYGPLGVALKRNIMQLWWRMFVEEAEGMYGVDAAILMNQKVWQASGHVDTFTDPLAECLNCHKRFRADHLVANKDEYAEMLSRIEKEFRKDVDESLKELEELERANNALTDALKSEIAKYLDTKQIDQYLIDAIVKNSKNRNLVRAIQSRGNELAEARKFQGDVVGDYLNTHTKCPSCGHQTWSAPRAFNMMFKTHVGAVEDESSISYLRPETAQGIFTNFKNVVDTVYPDVPFGIAQQGKAFRNEISPRDFIFRSREFEQMEIEYFVHPDQWETAFEEWIKRIHLWCNALGLPAEQVHELEVPEDDRAHYSKRTVDFEYDFPIGREELLGLAYRTDFDLMNIQNASGKSMEYRPKDGGAPFVPHVIEPSFGVERALMAVLSAAYTEDEVNGEKRIFLKLPTYLAPVKVAVLPLAKNKPELVAKAREVYALLKKEIGNVMWVDTGNIGKNYRKMDEIGVPYCVTVDFETLEGDTAGTVTVRHRDTTAQERVRIEDLLQHLS